MENDRAIPQRYMTVGEIAKKMGITVRTLQHYDKEGLLSPSAISGGGRRLYSDTDVIKLYQILSLKHLGFSLDEIKNQITTLDTPEAVAEVLANQADLVRTKIQQLSESLCEIEALRTEVLQMQTVNFKKYADIIMNLQIKNDFYPLIKHFDDQMLDHIRSKFDLDSGTAFLEKFTFLQEKAVQFQKLGIPADSEEAQQFVKEYWDMIMDFSDGDTSMFPKLIEMGQQLNSDPAWMEKQTLANAFIGPALEIYFTNLGTNPFQKKEE